MSCPLCKFFRRKVGRTASTESPTRCGDRACRVRKMQARVRCVRSACEPLRRSCVSSAAKCRQECDLPGARATLCGGRACRVREMQAKVRFTWCPRNLPRRSCVSTSARNAGESAICRLPAQRSAEIGRVECAKCRRECDLPVARATLCGDRACRVREMQARARAARTTLCGDPACPVRDMQVRVPCAACLRNPLRRSCVWSARNAGERGICTLCSEPFAEIVRDECAKCRREGVLPAVRATLCGDRAYPVREMQAKVGFACPRNLPRRSCVSSARNAGESAMCRLPAQSSAEIVRVESAKCRRECDLQASRATLYGNRACRVCEMQARVRFDPCTRNPPRRSCMSSARHAGEGAIWQLPATSSAEIVRVKCAKCRRKGDLPALRAALCGDRACRVREMPVRGVEYLGSWEISTGECIV